MRTRDERLCHSRTDSPSEVVDRSLSSTSLPRQNCFFTYSLIDFSSSPAIFFTNAKLLHLGWSSRGDLGLIVMIAW